MNWHQKPDVSGDVQVANRQLVVTENLHMTVTAQVSAF
jgi:hypothetical protein